MKEVSLLSGSWFGDTALTLTFPDGWDIVVVDPPKMATLSEEEIRNRLAQPIGTDRLSELAAQRSRAAIIIDDLTRPTPTSVVLPAVLDELAAGGIGRDQVTVIVAGGTHARASASDVVRKLGRQLSDELRVLVHDCREDLIYLGKSKRGTPLYANRHVMESDLKIGLGGLYPHRAAGFSGGSKIVMPGICGLETARHIHMKCQSAKRRAGTVESEFRKEMADFAERIRFDFIVNVALDRRRDVVDLFAGHPHEAFEEGARRTRERFAVVPLDGADVVVADAYPFDVTLHAALARGTLWPALAAKGATARIGIVACPRGVGTHEIFSMEASALIKLARLARRQVRAAWRYLTRPKSRRRGRKPAGPPFMFLSAGLSEEDMARVRPGDRVFQTWDALLQALESRLSTRRPKVVVYRGAGLMVEREPT